STKSLLGDQCSMSTTWERWRNKSVAIVVPLYNEQDNLLRVLEELRAFVRECPWHCQVILVNDGSTDLTAVMLDTQNLESSFHVLPLCVNLGIGKAVQAGFQYAVHLQADVALQLDGDGQHPV